MKLSEKAVKDFIKIYRKEFGETLSYGEAEIRAREFLEVIKWLASE